MNNSMSHIDVWLSEERGSYSRRRVVSFGANRPDRPVAGQLRFELDGDVLPDCGPLADAAVVALLFPAMRAGLDLRIHDRVSRRLLINLEEFQAAWRRWRPLDYAHISITADEEVDDSHDGPTMKAVSLFSGGVDSSFTLLRHRGALAGRASCHIAAAVLIHGFDIPLENSDAFAVVRNSARRALESVGVPLVCVKTNWRDVACRNWENEFAAGLAACLHQFSGVAGIGLVGSAEDYAHLHLPWGSNPITNGLLSGGALRIVTDGAGYTRSEKVALIARSPAFRDNLRVCWEGAVTGRNCGHCEKCLRTQLNFLAIGHAPDVAFSERPTPWKLLTLRARSHVQLAYLCEIQETASRQGIEASWRSFLRVSIFVNYVLLKSRQCLARVGWLRAIYRRVKGALRRPKSAGNRVTPKMPEIASQ